MDQTQGWRNQYIPWIADAAFTNANDYKSTTGYVFLAAGGALHGNPRNK